MQVPLGKPLFLIPGAMAILGLPQGSGVRHCAKGSSCLQETWGNCGQRKQPGAGVGEPGLGWDCLAWGWPVPHPLTWC